MALTRTISLDSVSSDGKTITIVDTTGSYDGTTNPGGFGSPNPATTDFTSLLIVASYFNGSIINMLIDDPTITQNFLAGTVLPLTSAIAVGVTGSYPFNDGAIKISSYAKMPVLNIVSYLGDNFVSSGDDLTPLLTADYLITPDYNVYQIDTTNSGNNSSVVFLKSNLLDSYTTGFPAYYASVYALNETEFICKLTNAIAAMAGQGGDEIDKSGYLMDMLVKKFSADFEFAGKDYKAADYTINSGINRLNRLLHG